jgi:hypothetical protein
MKLRIFHLFFLLWSLPIAAQQLQSPDEYLGYELGKKFTFHHQIVAYYQYIAQHSDKAKLVQCGKTVEDRPLMVMFVSAPENLAKLEQIRKNNLIQAGLLSGEIKGRTLPIVWFNYSIHGNEPAGSIASMQTLYALITEQRPEMKNWLKEMIIIIDPCANPDGYSGYVDAYNRKTGLFPHEDLATWEHEESYLGGRFNHYCFDLNRDWAWQTQSENRHRLAMYQDWLPQVQADFHEMEYYKSYFFAPAAKPFHESVSHWQREFQKHLGHHHAQYFKQNGWDYFNEDVYDMLYPSYGDTWGTFNGALSFTFEQGGGGKAGLKLTQSTGDTLTLKDRYWHHHIIGISTLEITYQYREKILKEFKKYFKESTQHPQGDYKTYIIKHQNPKANIKALLALLERQKIRFYHPAISDTNLVAFNYFKNQADTFRLEKQDIIISAYQPKSVLLKVLLEPKTYLEDSLTYDITAWSLPYSFGVKTYCSKQKIEPDTTHPVDLLVDYLPLRPAQNYLLEWKDVEDAQILSALLQKNILVKYASKDFVLANKTYQAGTLLIQQKGNEANSLDMMLKDLAFKHQKRLIACETIADTNIFHKIQKPKVALLLAENMRLTSMGEVWYYFEQVIRYPMAIIDDQKASSYLDLSHYNLLILPSGNYQHRAYVLESFVRSGGRIIALEDALETFANQKPFLLGKTPEVKSGTQQNNTSNTNTHHVYFDIHRESLRSKVLGAIYKVEADKHHFLTYGYENELFISKNNSEVYQYLPESQDTKNIGVFKKDSHITGFVGNVLKEKLYNTLTLGIERLGKGQIVYMTDSPLFRGFWYGGNLLFANAVFLGE